MSLPAFTLSGEVRRELLPPQLQQWMEKTKEQNLVSVGVVGEEPSVLPGFLYSIEVGDALIIDDAKTSDKSGSVKIISGWADADLSITLALLDVPVIGVNTVTPSITRYDCLREIVQVFKKMKEGKPQVYTIQHPLVAAWGVQGFLFKDLKTSETRGKKVINCTLQFDEYDSTTGKTQERQLGASENAAPQPAASPPVSDKTRMGLGKLEEKYAGL